MDSKINLNINKMTMYIYLSTKTQQSYYKNQILQPTGTLCTALPHLDECPLYLDIRITRLANAELFDETTVNNNCTSDYSHSNFMIIPWILLIFAAGWKTTKSLTYLLTFTLRNTGNVWNKSHTCRKSSTKGVFPIFKSFKKLGAIRWKINFKSRKR